MKYHYDKDDGQLQFLLTNQTSLNIVYEIAQSEQITSVEFFTVMKNLMVIGTDKIAERMKELAVATDVEQSK